MQGDLEPRKAAGPLPPFVARPMSPPRRESDSVPMPPWTSQRRSLGGNASATPLEPSAPPSEAPRRAPDAAREPWDEPYVASPDRGEEETMELDVEALELDEVVVDEPWELQEPDPLAEEEELLLETSAMDIAVDEEPWLVEPASVSDEQPWGASEIEVQEEPWTYEAAEPETTEAVWSLESADPNDAEVASESWADQVPEDPQPPLASFPGEAEAWDAVAAAPTADSLPDEERAKATADPAFAKLAERLESFAAELRTHGREAVTRGLASDRLSAALAGLIAGWQAAGGED